MDTNLVTIIAGIVILLLILVCVVIRLKTKPSLVDKQKAQQFLEGLSEVLYNKMMSIVINFDVNDYSSIQDFESQVLESIYDELWKYVSDELEEISKTDILTAMALKVLNKEYVEEFIRMMINKYDVVDRINGIWAENKEESLIEEDEKLQEEFADQNQYVEDSDKLELEAANPDQPTDEELSNLNPPTDEEKEYDPETDSSVEVVEETFVDSRGRLRSKATGRFV